MEYCQLNYTIHVPREWYVGENNLDWMDDIISDVLTYMQTWGTTRGAVITRNGLPTIVMIDHQNQMWWFRRLRQEDDHRPEHVGYFPPLAMEYEEDMWGPIICRNVDGVYCVAGNNDDDDDDDDINNVIIDNDFDYYDLINDNNINFNEDDENDVSVDDDSGISLNDYDDDDDDDNF
ncbi:hypothetical protein PV328_012358 [Microctonus aethiopoides]|uniref:Uncharacterized protein n=1 Tax=Microctonus aethiopoides TaxID=144406 RepID=A0AA39C2D9_9HYME|nr:hypothetical protein PV328_012358 [Microctonus aethiopoides]